MYFAEVKSLCYPNSIYECHCLIDSLIFTLTEFLYSLFEFKTF